MENALQCWDREGSEVPQQRRVTMAAASMGSVGHLSHSLHKVGWTSPQPPVDLFSFRHSHIKHANVKPSKGSKMVP